MWPCSPHLKPTGPFLLSEDFGEMLLCRPFRLVGPVDILCITVFVIVPVLSLCLHGVSRPVVLVVLVAIWFVCVDAANCIHESFMGGS